MQKLPSGKFKWLNENEINKFDINNINLEGKYGYFVEFDIHVPHEIHDYLNEYPLACEKKVLIHHLT